MATFRQLINWATTSTSLATPIPVGLAISRTAPYQVPANQNFYITKIHAFWEGAAINTGTGQTPAFVYSTSSGLATAQINLELFDGSQAHDVTIVGGIEPPLYIIPTGNYFGLYMGLMLAAVGAGVAITGYEA